MSGTSKKQTFLHGAALLTMATIAVKVIGALYKIPLKMVIGDQGFSYFNAAYSIYTMLLMISTTGLPVAMSRMISQASSLGHYRQVRRIYSTSRAIFLGLGLASSLLMIVFCRQLAVFMKQPDAWFAILCLCPCALLMGILSTCRGFFQGQGNMIPTSVSQVIEAVCKLLIGLAAAILISYYTKSVYLAAGGLILGVTVGCLISSGYLIRNFGAAYAELPQSREKAESFSQTAKRLLSIAIPITIGAAGMQVLVVLQTNLYMGQLLTACGYSQEQAEIQNGIYYMAQTIYNMPIAFLAPITISILPAITAQLTVASHRKARETAESAARVTGLLSLPCAVGLILLSKPIMALLGGYTGEKLILAAGLLSLLGVSVLLHAIVQLTNTIMQAYGHAQIPVVNMLISGVLMCISVYVLTGNPALGLLGVPMGIAVCNISLTVLNIFSLQRCVPRTPAIIQNVLRPLLPALVMGGAAYLTYWGLTALLGENGSRLLLCALPVAVGGCVYLVLAVKCKSITREDCLLLPKGEKIANWLHL